MNDKQTIKVAEFLPVLDGIIGFMGEALSANDAAQVKIAQLEAQLLDKDKVILEKVASASAAVPNTPVFKREEVARTLDRLQELNIINGEMNVKFASDIAADPRTILPLLTKISEALLAAPAVEGVGIEKEAAADGTDDSDPDGWGAFARGQPVKLKP